MIAASAAVVACAIVFLVRNVPTPGDISSALSQHPSAYTLSLGHVLDLTLSSFAYLRVPLIVAAVAFLIGALGTMRTTGQRAFIAAALMMVLFFHAARLALVVFDPYMSSKPLADALLRAPAGELITQGHYYPFSSVFFYTNERGLLLNGRVKNLEYGSYAPGSADVFIDDRQFRNDWLESDRFYLIANATALPQLQRLAGSAQLNVVAMSGGKLLLTNHPLSASLPDQGFARTSQSFAVEPR